MVAVPPGYYPRIAVLPCCHLKGSSWSVLLRSMVSFKSGVIVECSPTEYVGLVSLFLDIFWNRSFWNRSFWNRSFWNRSPWYLVDWNGSLWNGMKYSLWMLECQGVLTGVFTASSCRYGDGLDTLWENNLEWCRPGYHAGERTISCYGDTRSDLGGKGHSHNLMKRIIPEWSVGLEHFLEHFLKHFLKHFWRS